MKEHLEGYRKYTVLEGDLEAIRAEGKRAGKTLKQIEAEVEVQRKVLEKKLADATASAAEGPDNVLDLSKF